MKLLDVFILLLLVILLGLGLYVLWLNLPGEFVQYEEFNLDTKTNIYSNSAQFYPNMRYPGDIIKYGISNSCDSAKKRDVERAFSFISERTILKFQSSDKGEIQVLCTDISPKPEETGHFIAGEGGPSEIINTSNYAVILSGKVSLYRRTNECVKPNIAIHEILHALGFDHNSNPQSIMYPITECGQELDAYIVNEIKRLYSIKSAPDLAIEKLVAEKNGPYLNFEVFIGNIGLKDSESSSLVLYAGEVLIKEFALNNTEIGSSKRLKVENLRIPRKSETLIFKILSFEKELNGDNNKAEVSVVEQEKQ